MELKEIMTRNVQVIAPDATARDAARMMKNLDVGGIPVCDGDRLRGFVTDRDIVVRAVAEGQDPSSCTVADVMTDKIIWCYEDSDVEEAGRIMQENKVRRLAVVDRNKRLVGILSLGDLAVEGEDEDFAGEVLETVSEPAQPST
ncbi:CBS domain-containing protein [Vulgatibacter sp.]|uniref:CBS domain-containing protein n=1 Tax=Vulgatibacter sp. TaxID=1971226 RepID=UPI003569BD0F